MDAGFFRVSRSAGIWRGEERRVGKRRQEAFTRGLGNPPREAFGNPEGSRCRRTLPHTQPRAAAETGAPLRSLLLRDRPPPLRGGRKMAAGMGWSALSLPASPGPAGRAPRRTPGPGA